MGKRLTVMRVAILGRHQSTCEGIAKLLIEGGIYAPGPDSPEFYQAVVIDWNLGLLNTYGSRWGEEATATIKRLSNS